MERLNPSELHYRLTKIPIVLGMPVMLVQNFDVEDGIVNGATGLLKSVRYTTDSDGNRILQSCVIAPSDKLESTGADGSIPMPGLETNEFPVCQDLVKLHLKDRY
ncbi:hypothetical protein BKA70DRAFT_1122221, partial [Coprinopsis sp. MPI-PUGE-AT-0042]